MNRVDAIRGLGCLMVLAVVGAGAVRGDEPLAGDLKGMQGTWVSKDEQGESTWVFEGETLRLDAPGRKYVIKLKVDATTMPEKSIDLDVAADSPNAKDYKAAGIYKFEGEDKLTICFAETNAGRPKEFATDFSKGQFSFTMTRKK